MNIKKIVLSSLLAASTAASTGCSMNSFFKKDDKPVPAKQMVYAPELNPNEHELITDEEYKCLDSEEPVRFETAVTADEASNGTPVSLYDSNGNSVSKMYDDGTHSDRIAGDGIYTCSYKPETSEEANFSYSAKIGDFTTEPASVRYFDAITDKDVEDMNDVADKMSEIGAAYLDSNGNISDAKRSEAISAVGEYAEELYKSGEAVNYRVNEEYDNVVVKLSSGISMIYDFAEEGVESGVNTNISMKKKSSSSSSSKSSSSTPLQKFKITIQNLKIKGYKPFASDCTWLGSNLEETMNNVTSSLSPFVTNEGIVEDDAAGPNSVKTFGPNQIVIWRGHGGFDDKLHSILCTTKLFKASDYTKQDIIEDRILVAAKIGLTGEQLLNDPTNAKAANRKVYITSEYIDAHCPDMTDSFVFLGCCHGAEDSVLAASFINKNCNVVFGFSDTVTGSYDNNMMQTIFEEMCKRRISTSTGTLLNFYTVGEALETAKKTHGDKDSKTGAKPILMGNRNYKLAEAIISTNDDPKANNVNRGSLTLDTYYVSVKAGSSSNKLNVKSLPTGCKSVCWSIDNSDIATIDQKGVVKGVSKGSTTGHVVTDDGLYYVDFVVNVT